MDRGRGRRLSTGGADRCLWGADARRQRGKVEWRGDAKDLYDKRLTEAVDLVDALRDAYGKAGSALADYAAAVRTAKGHADSGVTDETRLGRLIAHLAAYQVEESNDRTKYPSGIELWLAQRVKEKFEPAEMSQRETDMLGDLSVGDQMAFMDVKEEAYRVATEQFPANLGGADDGHNDAFRHTAREAMDLHNNELGRAIGAQYPDASPEELARRVREAVDSGQAVVIDQNGDVKYSDAVRPGETGMADESKTLPGHPITDSGP